MTAGPSCPVWKTGAISTCLPYFRKAETRDIGPNDYHGGEGPVSVTTPKAGNNPLFHAMVEAGVQAGYPRTEDLNGYQQEGFGPMDRTVTPRGRRASTARGYLDEAKKRSTLTIVTHATTDASCSTASAR
jgi:choline dehydrogenase